MKSMIYYIGGLKRMLAFPYPVEEVGLMVNHYAMHRQNRLQRLFICFSFNADKYNPPESAGIPRFHPRIAESRYRSFYSSWIEKPLSAHSEISVKKLFAVS